MPKYKSRFQFKPFFLQMTKYCKSFHVFLFGNNHSRQIVWQMELEESPPV